MALLFYFLALFGAAFIWPSWRIWKRDGVNTFVIPPDDSAHGVIGYWFKGLIAGVLLVAAAIAFGADRSWFGALIWADHIAVKTIGIAALAISLPLIVVAQAHMGRSWRIGFDSRATPELVTGGLFSRSRNPIFAGIRLSLLGFLLVEPNGATLSCFLLGEALIAVQVRLEEDYLKTSIGNPYLDYLASTPRWV